MTSELRVGQNRTCCVDLVVICTWPLNTVLSNKLTKLQNILELYT